MRGILLRVGYFEFSSYARGMLGMFPSVVDVGTHHQGMP
jgi:hypothetical protein